MYFSNFKTKNKKQIILLTLTLIMFLGISFGAVFFIYDMSQSKANVLETGLISIEFTEGEAINLASIVPVIDEIGLEFDPYEFSVTNTSSIPIKMNIQFLEDEGNTLPIEAVRYGLMVDDELVGKGSLSKLDEEGNFVTYENFAPGKTINCKLMLWVDYYYTSSRETFSWKIKVIGESSDAFNDPTYISLATKDYPNNIITLASGQAKTLNLSLFNNSKEDILYKLYYTVQSGTGEIVGTSVSDNLSGTMNTSKDMELTLANPTDETLTIQLGVKGALEGVINLEEGQKEIVINTSGPVITSASDAGDGKVTFTVEDSGTGVKEYCINTGSNDTENCTWYEAIVGTQTTGEIIEDNETYYVHVKDNIGNIGHSSGFEMAVDKDGPIITTEITSSSKGNNDWYKLLSITGTATDEKSSVVSISSCVTTNTTCTPNSSSNATNKTVSISTSNSSSQKVCFQATDTYGNQSEITCSSAYKVDVDSPSVTSVSDAGNGKVTFTATDIHSGPYQYCVNKSASSTSGCTWYSASSGSQTTGAIITENNTFYVHLKDNAGNVGNSSAVSVKYDNTGPTVSVSVASSTAGVSSWYSAISIKGTATDDKSSVTSISSCITTSTTCVPNSSTSATNKTVSITGSNTSARRVCFNATDSVGNTGATTCSSAYKVDQTAPSVTSVSDAGSGKITFTASDSHSGVYQYCVNQSATSTTGCSWKTASSGTQTTGAVVTENGTYYVHVRDKAYKVGHSSVISMTVAPNAAQTIIGKYGTGGLIAVNTDGTLYDGTGTIREYRYSGATVNNYIFFDTDGDDVKDTNEIWRIIGIFKNSSGNWNLKLVRNTVLAIEELQDTYTYGNIVFKIRHNYCNYEGEPTNYVYWNRTEALTNNNDEDWTTAGLQYFLNGTDGYYGTFSSRAKALVDANYTYYLGNVDTSDDIDIGDTASSGYTAERTLTNINSGNKATWKGAIALMYPSDYGYSTTNRYWGYIMPFYSGLGDSSSWIYVTTTNSGGREWLLSPTPYGEVTFLEDAGRYLSSLPSSYSYYSANCGDEIDVNVRPTLNLLSTATIDANHTGSSSDPYILVE